MTVSRMMKTKQTKSSKSVHSVVLGGGVVPTTVKDDIKKCTITDLVNAYKRVMVSAILRGDNKLN